MLLVYAGDRHWAKLCFEFSPQRIPMAVTVVTKHTSDDCNYFTLADSAEGPMSGQPPTTMVGFLAQSPAGPGCAARFDHIALHAGAPADLRDGS